MRSKDSFKIKGNVKLTFENVETGEKEVFEYKNVFCTVGKESIASRLVGANTAQVTYLALGTGVSPSPVAGDTALDNELFRKQISSDSASGAVASFRTFFSTDEANDTLTEIGLFGDDASATADSGTLFAARAINKVKTSSETLTVDWELTVG